MQVVVLGLGYVGLVTGVGLALNGHQVVGVDVAAARVAAVAAGQVPFFEPGLPERLAAVLADGRLTVTTDLAAALTGADIAMIAVGTPEGPGGIDLAQVEAAAEAIGRHRALAAPDLVVVVKSTVVPGTTDTRVRAALARRTAAVPALAMNPEFLREGTAVADFLAPDRIVVGADDPAAGARVAALYRGFDAPLLQTSLRDAEAIKYATNTLLATLISFSNEWARLCEATPGTDIETVMRGLHLDRRLAGAAGPAGLTTYLRAGLGYGGSCLPKDIAALRAHARTTGVATPLLDAASAINEARPGDIVTALAGCLGGLAGRRVALLGLAFKPGTDDVRRSPGLALREHLLAAGAEVQAHDPLVTAAQAGLPAEALASDVADAVAGADAAILATAWPDYAALPWEALLATMRTPWLVDTRRMLAREALPPAARLLAVGLAPSPAKFLEVST